MNNKQTANLNIKLSLKTKLEWEALKGNESKRLQKQLSAEEFFEIILKEYIENRKGNNI